MKWSYFTVWDVTNLSQTCKEDFIGKEFQLKTFLAIKVTA
jgi:hypothetical protein